MAKLKKFRAVNEERVKYDQNKWQQNHRNARDESDRLRQFREATMFNAIFICTCCQQRMFQSNIRLYTKELQEEINSKKEGHSRVCIEKVIQSLINGQHKTYICLTCVKHMKNKKLPPKSAMNRLHLYDSDAAIKAQEFVLTELE